jgi:hypothetical protein
LVVTRIVEIGVSGYRCDLRAHTMKRGVDTQLRRFAAFHEIVTPAVPQISTLHRNDVAYPNLAQICTSSRKHVS